MALPNVHRWIESTADRLCLLTGKPGSGKSMVSAWLGGQGPAPQSPASAAHLEYIRAAVCAVHFCQAARGNSPKAFAESVARQLAQTVEGFAGHVATSLSEGAQVNVNATVSVTNADHSNVTGVNLTLQLGSLNDEPAFDRVLRTPLRTLYEAGYTKPILVIVDALDESLNYAGVLTIPQLLGRLGDLPEQVRILATSRDEPFVLKFFRNTPRYDLVVDAPAGAADLSDYARCEFSFIVGVERKWGRRGSILSLLALEGHPNEMDYPPGADAGWQPTNHV